MVPIRAAAPLARARGTLLLARNHGPELLGRATRAAGRLGAHRIGLGRAHLRNAVAGLPPAPAAAARSSAARDGRVHRGTTRAGSRIIPAPARPPMPP